MGKLNHNDTTALRRESLCLYSSLKSGIILSFPGDLSRQLLPEPTDCNVLLQDLPPDSVASISDLNIPEEDAVRLKALGICVGRQIQLVHAGDPLIIRVLGTRIGMSARLATGVVVEPLPIS